MRIAAIAVLAGLAALPISAQAAVEVAFVHPERYSDAGLDRGYGPATRDPVLKGIREHLERLGARYLKPNQTLKIDVLDIDLAGRFEWWRPYAYNVRIMRGVTWPRVAMRYTLEENGTTVLSAEEAVMDLNYQMRLGTSLSSDPLRYEKEMLGDWFRNRFGKLKAAAG